MPELAFATPRKLPKPAELKGRVVVLDIAFASEAQSSGFQKVTKKFIDGMGKRLVGWIDHHDSDHHVEYAGDDRFVLAKKSEHGACPEMITPELVARIGQVDTIVCHNDFDGLASAAKWIRGGVEPYPGCDDDARAVDTRVGEVGPVGKRFDRALRGRPRDAALFGVVVRHLAGGLADASLWEPIDAAAREVEPLENEARAIARRYVALGRDAVFVDASEARPYDKTLLLLLGQERATVSVVLDKETLTLAAPFQSGLNFLEMLGLSGGMPTRVSVPRGRMADVYRALGADPVSMP